MGFLDVERNTRMRLERRMNGFVRGVEHLDNRLDDKFSRRYELHLSNAILLDYHRRNFQMDHDRRNNASERRRIMKLVE